MAARTPRYWWRKLRRQRVELWVSDGETHVHVKARAAKANAIVAAIRPHLAAIPDFPEERKRLYRQDSAAEVGDDAAMPAGQERWTEILRLDGGS